MSSEEETQKEKIAAMAVKVGEVSKLESKIDKLTDLVNTMNISLIGMKNEFVEKSEFKLKCSECDKRFKDAEESVKATKTGQRQLFWAAVATGLTLILWLVEQLIHVKVTLGA